MKKTKQELIDEAAKLAKEHQQKKAAIERIFSELDREQKITNKHIQGIAAVNDIVKDLEILEEKYENIIQEIKGS